MTDREKLELAAKACGIELTWEHGTPQKILLFRGHLPNYEDWNPFTDQADSDCMACDLEIDIDFTFGCVKAESFCGIECNAMVAHDGTREDRRRAVREARLAVAAEIGRLK